MSYSASFVDGAAQLSIAERAAVDKATTASVGARAAEGRTFARGHDAEGAAFAGSGGGAPRRRRMRIDAASGSGAVSFDRQPLAGALFGAADGGDSDFHNGSDGDDAPFGSADDVGVELPGALDGRPPAAKRARIGGAPPPMPGMHATVREVLGADRRPAFFAAVEHSFSSSTSAAAPAGSSSSSAAAAAQAELGDFLGAVDASNAAGGIDDDRDGRARGGAGGGGADGGGGGGGSDDSVAGVSQRQPMEGVCFGCMWGNNAFDESLKNQMGQLRALYEREYGRRRNDELAAAVYAFFRVHIYAPMARAGRPIPDWPIDMIIEHITRHTLDPRIFIGEQLRRMRELSDALYDHIFLRAAPPGAEVGGGAAAAAAFFAHQKNESTAYMNAVKLMLALYAADPRRMLFFDENANYELVRARAAAAGVPSASDDASFLKRSAAP